MQFCNNFPEHEMTQMATWNGVHQKCIYQLRLCHRGRATARESFSVVKKFIIQKKMASARRRMCQFASIFSDMRGTTLQIGQHCYLQPPSAGTILKVRLWHSNAIAWVAPSSGTTRRLLWVSNCSATLQFRMAVNGMCHHMHPP